MNFFKEHLELIIQDIAPEGSDELVCGEVGKIKDKTEDFFVVGGVGALYCYETKTGKRETIDSKINCGVGLALEDIDGDGIEEIFVSEFGESFADKASISMYKYITGKWKKYTVIDDIPGYPHDIVFGDIDNDGKKEIVTISCYSPTPGIHIVKPKKYRDNLPIEWTRYSIQQGICAEGTTLADLNGDGNLEIICGPDWYEQPAEGPFSGNWNRKTYAPSFREMCRTQAIDITGNGKPDIVITDSEYMDGKLSWFENRLEDAGPDWVEHLLNEKVIYAHSLQADRVNGKIHLFLAEMEQGGWNAPYNHDARLLLYSTNDQGKTWTEKELYKGEGTHEAKIRYEEKEGITVYGKTLGREWKNPRVQIFSSRPVLNHLAFHHSFIDRDKQTPGTDILLFYPQGKKNEPWIACGRYVYEKTKHGRNRLEVPETSQIINAYDIDADGQDELIVTYEADKKGKIKTFSNQIYQKKLKKKEDGSIEWETGRIGEGNGDWPHGSLITKLPDNRPALVTSYHSAHNGGIHDFPQIFSSPKNGAKTDWDRRTLAEINYGEEMLIADVFGKNSRDIIAGNYVLRNNRDGTYSPFLVIENFAAARIAVADIMGNGRSDILMVEEDVDYKNKVAAFARFILCECPENPEKEPWKIHKIDSIRSPHSISCGDVDGDGIVEIFVAEHDPFWPYRSQNRMFVYKTLDHGKTWHRKTIDSRFEHHDGLKLVDWNGGKALLSHGWKDDIYVHLWEIEVLS